MGSATNTSRYSQVTSCKTQFLSFFTNCALEISYIPRSDVCPNEPVILQVALHSLLLMLAMLLIGISLEMIGLCKTFLHGDKRAFDCQKYSLSHRDF